MTEDRHLPLIELEIDDDVGPDDWARAIEIIAEVRRREKEAELRYLEEHPDGD